MKKIQLHVKILLVFALIITLSTGCKTKNTAADSTTSGATPQSWLTKASENEISVLAFNVENMFDNTHDEGTEDYPYLAFANKNTAEVQAFCKGVKSGFYQQECFQKNWSDDAVSFKLSQVAKTIRYLDNGKGPDIILMAEVENIKILNRLADEELKDLGYQTRVLIEGPDTRGIDPAIISKFPLKGKPQLHIIPFKESDPQSLKRAQKSRGVIEATVILPNKKELTVMAVHFPSQANPTTWRAQAINFLKDKMLEYQKAGRAVIAGGDMNTIDLEDRYYGYFSRDLSQAGAVSHLVGCKHCEGSHNHKGEWSFLDILVFGHALAKADLELIPESIQVVKAPHSLKRNGTPLRFDETKKEGVADHFPLYARLKILNKK